MLVIRRQFQDSRRLPDKKGGRITDASIIEYDFRLPRNFYQIFQQICALKQKYLCTITTLSSSNQTSPEKYQKEKSNKRSIVALKQLTNHTSVPSIKPLKQTKNLCFEQYYQNQSTARLPNLVGLSLQNQKLKNRFSPPKP